MTFNSYSTFFILSINMNSITKKQLFQFLSTNNIPFRKSMKKDQISHPPTLSFNYSSSLMFFSFILGIFYLELQLEIVIGLSN